MRIGELAELAGVSTKTLRYYEEIGLLPSAERTPSGYRDYGPELLDRLSFIRAAQAVGLALGEIREVVAFRDRGDPPCAQVLELIERRRGELDARISELQGLRGELDRLARRARDLNPADCPPDKVCHLIGGDRVRLPRQPRHRTTDGRSAADFAGDTASQPRS